ncbi:MAG: thiamine-phosphate kinase, partial [Synechococcus sp.]
MPEGLTLSQIGEQDLIRRLAAYARPDQWNDDAALLPEISPERWVISSDTLVEGVHFSAATTPASAAGWRAAAANLSDLAAMGCRRCEGITVALSAPGDTEVHWIEQAYGGMQELLQCHGGHLLGGDCSGGKQLVLAITALGPVHPDQQIQRGAGKPGDWLISTGAHGRSALGLQLLLGEAAWAKTLPSEQQQTAIRCHQHPQPRFDAVAALHASRPDGQPWRVGGTDS